MINPPRPNSHSDSRSLPPPRFLSYTQRGVCMKVSVYMNFHSSLQWCTSFFFTSVSKKRLLYSERTDFIASFWRGKAAFSRASSFFGKRIHCEIAISSLLLGNEAEEALVLPNNCVILELNWQQQEFLSSPAIRKESHSRRKMRWKQDL